MIIEAVFFHTMPEYPRNPRALKPELESIFFWRMTPICRKPVFHFSQDDFIPFFKYRLLQIRDQAIYKKTGELNPGPSWGDFVSAERERCSAYGFLSESEKMISVPSLSNAMSLFCDYLMNITDRPG